MTCLTALPPELLQEICHYCHSEDLKKLACCCSALSNVISRETLWKNVTIPSRSLLNYDEGKLYHLSFTKCLTLAMKDKENQCQETTRLNYKCVLSYCKPCRLTELSIECPGLQFSDFLTLAANLMNGLRKIKFTGWCAYGHDEAFALICKELKHLVDLSITARFDVVSEDLLIGPDDLSRSLSTIKTLQKLRICSCYFDEQGFCHSGRMLQLREVDFSPCERDYCSRFSSITDFSIWDLLTSPGLTHINFTSCAISDDSLLTIGSVLVNVVSLIITATLVTNGGIYELQNLRKLKQLHIGENEYIGDLSLDYISGLIQLEILNASRTRVTDGGVRYLQCLVNLRKLYLANNDSITDTSFQYFRNLKKLDVLDISGTKVSDAAILEFQTLEPAKKRFR